MDLKNDIRKIIDTYGTPQKFLAGIAGTSNVTIHLWLNDSRELPSHSKSKLTDWLNNLK